MFYIQELNILHYKSATDIYGSAFYIHSPLSREWRYRNRQLSLGIFNMDGDLLGFSFAVGNHILYLAVHPLFQDKGIGTCLLQNLIRVSRVLGISITLEPLEDVVSWYSAHGFRKTTRKHMVYHKYCTRQRYM
jgi:ribosomal protein S18 acetylase RimI-like enzyme